MFSLQLHLGLLNGSIPKLINLVPSAVEVGHGERILLESYPIKQDHVYRNEREGADE
jgi:hypothetical protein